MREEDGALSADEAVLVAHGIASAITTEAGLEPVQISLLGTILEALTGVPVDLGSMEPIRADELAEALKDRSENFRRRVVHHMVLGELILRPIPPDVARRVRKYSEALGVQDQFVRIAHRYSQGGFGLAWLDLHQSGFTEHWENARTDQLKTTVKLEHQLAAGVEDPDLAELWAGFEHFAPGTLGRGVWDMYRGRGFGLPGSTGGASAYLAQHDFVHVLADYGTNLNGELEVFSLIGRADPDPKGFAWLATLVGLFETGYVADAGFFTGDLKERRLDNPAMHVRVADALYGVRSCATGWAPTSWRSTITSSPPGRSPTLAWSSVSNRSQNVHSRPDRLERSISQGCRGSSRSSRHRSGCPPDVRHDEGG